MTIELTADEASMIRYALNEMAAKRRQHAFDFSDADLSKEAIMHCELAKRFSNWEGVKKP